MKIAQKTVSDSYETYLHCDPMLHAVFHEPFTDQGQRCAFVRTCQEKIHALGLGLAKLGKYSFLSWCELCCHICLIEQV